MAVYTEITDEELALFMEKYDIGELESLKGITEGVSNSNYFLQTNKALYILTIYEERTNASNLPYFLNLMTHLINSFFQFQVLLKHTQQGNLIVHLLHSIL